ncbi:MAG: hypothetical protein RIB60_08225 [Phycisphaerales bacterium]
MSQSPITTEQLAALIAGELSEPEAAALRLSIQHDADAADRFVQLEQLARFLSEERDAQAPADAMRRAHKAFAASRPGLIETVRNGVRRIVAALEFDSRMPSAALGLRGSAQAAQLTFSCEDAEIDLEIVAEGAEGWRLRGQIDTGLEDSVAIDLVRTEDETTVAHTTARTDGEFILDTPAGSFSLRIRIGKTLIDAGPIVIP